MISLQYRSPSETTREAFKPSNKIVFLSCLLSSIQTQTFCTDHFNDFRAHKGINLIFSLKVSQHSGLLEKIGNSQHFHESFGP